MTRLLHILLTLAVLAAPALHTSTAHDAPPPMAAAHAEGECPSHDQGPAHDQEHCPCPQHHDSSQPHGVCAHCYSPARTEAAQRVRTRLVLAPLSCTRGTSATEIVRLLVPGRTATGVSPPSASC